MILKLNFKTKMKKISDLEFKVPNFLKLRIPEISLYKPLRLEDTRRH